MLSTIWTGKEGTAKYVHVDVNAQLAMSSADNTTCKGYDARREKCGKSVIQKRQSASYKRDIKFFH